MSSRKNRTTEISATHCTIKTLPAHPAIQQLVPDRRGGLALGRASSHKTFAINLNADNQMIRVGLGRNP